MCYRELEAFSSDVQAREGLLLVGSLYILSLLVSSKRKLSSKGAALTPCVWPI